MAVMPRTKVRLIDYYIDKYVKDPIIAAKFRRVDKIIVETFKVLDMNHLRGKAKIRSTKNGAEYRVVVGINVSRVIQTGDVRTCLIHPWEEDGTYRLGAVLAYEPTEFKRSSTKSIAKPKKSALPSTKKKSKYRINIVTRK